MPRSCSNFSTSAATSAGDVSSPEPRLEPEIKPRETPIWLLDGFNILHAALFANRDRSSWWAAEHRERLIARVCGFTEVAEEVWIAFDGARDNEPDARRLRTGADVPVYLIFAPSADDWLVKRVRTSSRPDRISVVTRDRRVGGRARHAGASVVAPAQFLLFCPEA